mgnify:CR=1 FL=1
MAIEFKTFNISLPVDLMEEVDQYVENRSVDRSVALDDLISVGLAHENLMSVTGQLIDRVLELERNARLELLNRVSELEERLSEYEEEF